MFMPLVAWALDMKPRAAMARASWVLRMDVSSQETQINMAKKFRSDGIDPLAVTQLIFIDIFIDRPYGSHSSAAKP
jgi:hypothetical protein